MRPIALTLIPKTNNNHTKTITPQFNQSPPICKALVVISPDQKAQLDVYKTIFHPYPLSTI
jgi:hypothetical protein